MEQIKLQENNAIIACINCNEKIKSLKIIENVKSKGINKNTIK